MPLSLLEKKNTNQKNHINPINIKKNQSKSEIIKIKVKDNYRGQSIGKLSNSLYYVNINTLIKDLVNELNHKTDILSLAVVDDEQKPKGIIIRKDLFDMLGKPYGKEILENKKVDKCLTQVKSFNELRNIFSVVNELGTNLEKNKTERYLILNSNNEFKGIFTNIDLLSYLSEITQKDIQLAKNLQLNLVQTKTVLDDKNFDFIALSKMAKEVGGDFYYTKAYSPSHWLFSLCDVSGKGVAAAMVTAVLGGVFTMFDFKQGLDKFLKKLNHFIFNTFHGDRFLTGIFIKFDSTTGKCIIYDMGHSYLYVLRNNQFYNIKSKTKNYPVGIIETIDINSFHVQLQKNDILVSFTDGIIEQINENDEEYSISNIPKFLRKYKSEALEISMDELFNHINDFKGSEPQHDDMSLMLIKYK